MEVNFLVDGVGGVFLVLLVEGVGIEKMEVEVAGRVRRTEEEDGKQIRTL